MLGMQPCHDIDQLEEVLNELHRAHEAAYNMRDSIRVYYISRGKIASKLCKYPNVEDYAVLLPVSVFLREAEYCSDCT